MGKTVKKRYRNKLGVKHAQFLITTHLRRHNVCTRAKGDGSITEEKWTKFLIVTFQELQESYYKDK